MARVWVRILVLLFTVAITAGVVWKATTNEQDRGRMRQASQQSDTAAADLLYEISDLRASLYAYVAPGQGPEFWTNRAHAQLESVRTRLHDLDAAAAAANYPLADAAALLDTLTRAERRARSAVRDEVPLIAGDVIFTEGREALDELGAQVSGARQAMARAASAREGGAANEQSLLAGALIGAWIFALILLVPVQQVSVPAHAAPPPAMPRPESPGEVDVLQLHDVPEPLDDIPDLPEQIQVAAPAAHESPSSDVDGERLSLVPVAAELPIEQPATPAFQALAALCSDITRVADIGELTPILERAGTLIGARGLVVWLASNGASELMPAVWWGYDPQLLARMGAIPVDDHNLTAAAFRTQQPTRVPAEEDTPGAVAVPLVSAVGVSGVLAAEVLPGVELERSAAIAAVLAAQLANLFAAPAASGEPPPQPAHV